MRNTFLNFALVLSAATSLLWGCDTYKLVENTSSEAGYSYKMDTVSIFIDSASLQSYNVYSTFIENDIAYLAGYNSFNHTVDVFDLAKNEFRHHIQLVHQGPNAVGEIEGLFWHTSDSIFAYAMNTLSIINKAGDLVDRIPLIGPNPEVAYVNNLYFRTIYNKERNVVYFFNLTPADKKAMYLNAPLISELHLSTKRLEDLPITYSQYYKKNNGALGFLSWVNLWETMDQKIIYNFQYESNVYSYDMDSEKVKNYGAKTEEFSNLSGLVRTNEEGEVWVSHALENTHFFPVIYDKYRNLHYRFNWGNIPSSQEDSHNSSFMDKPLSVTVLDAGFNWVMEIRLPDNTININTWFVSKEGLYMSPTHPNKTDVKLDYLEFYILKVLER